jgi:TonB-dependent SusC/RagA subfamily outer membrane receptor
MRAPGRRLPMQLLLIPVSLAAACASNPSSVARTAPVDLNAVATRDAAAAAGEERHALRDMPRAEAARYGRMEELLAHRVPALDVRSRGGGRFVLAIRGRPAQIGAAEPLVVIDGVPYYRGGADMLAQLSPARVRRIEVLKDVASTTRYGRHGANGVVVVTTHRGRD